MKQKKSSRSPRPAREIQDQRGSEVRDPSLYEDYEWYGSTEEDEEERRRQEEESWKSYLEDQDRYPYGDDVEEEEDDYR
jgi:hypothetical protein